MDSSRVVVETFPDARSTHKSFPRYPLGMAVSLRSSHVLRSCRPGPCVPRVPRSEFLQNRHGGATQIPRPLRAAVALRAVGPSGPEAVGISKDKAACPDMEQAASLGSNDRELLSGDREVAPAVPLPGALVMAQDEGTLLAVADGGDAVRGDPPPHH